MANVGTVIARTAKAALCVHVRAVHVNLPAMVMYDLADFADGRLEHAMRARVRHHQRGEITRVRVRFSSEIGQIDIAIF